MQHGHVPPSPYATPPMPLPPPSPLPCCCRTAVCAGSRQYTVHPITARPSPPIRHDALWGCSHVQYRPCVSHRVSPGGQACGCYLLPARLERAVRHDALWGCSHVQYRPCVSHRVSPGGQACGCHLLPARLERAVRRRSTRVRLRRVRPQRRQRRVGLVVRRREAGCGGSRRHPRRTCPHSPRRLKPLSHALTSDSFNSLTPRLLVWSGDGSIHI
jgi:hypothetical protein